MPEMNRTKSEKENAVNLKSNSKTLTSFPFIERLDGQTIIQAVVMSELLGKPKAKRRKRGRI